MEVEGPEVERWANRTASKHGFVEVVHTVEVHGTCADCARAGVRTLKIQPAEQPPRIQSRAQMLTFPVVSTSVAGSRVVSSPSSTATDHRPRLLT